MNLFDLPDATDDEMKELGWGGAADMLNEGAEMASLAVDASVDELQNFLVELTREGLLSEEHLYKLAGMEQACFMAIHQHGTLTAMAKITTMFNISLEKYKAEQAQAAAESA